MTTEDFVKIILAKPIFKSQSGTRAKIQNDEVRSYIPVAIGRITGRYDFKFAEQEEEFSGGTVANQSDYEFNSNKGQAIDIINIRYGIDLRELEKYEDIEMDNMLTNMDNPTTIFGWYPMGESMGMPKFRLIGTPTISGEKITLRFTVKVINVESFPETWIYVLESAVMAGLGEYYETAQGGWLGNRYLEEFEKNLRQMIDYYEKQRLSKRPVMQDPQVRNRNIERNQLHGYS